MAPNAIPGSISQGSRDGTALATHATNTAGVHGARSGGDGGAASRFGNRQRRNEEKAPSQRQRREESAIG